MSIKEIATCGTCGGTNVQADAYAVWNAATQEWEVSGTFDKGCVCDDCNGETRIVFRECTAEDMKGVHQ